MKKNNIFVKSIIYILILCGLFQSMAAAAFAENTDTAEDNTEKAVFTYPEYEILKYIGALDGFEDYSADALITKGDFLKILMKATGMNYDLSPEDKIQFYDVQSESEFSSVVSTAYSKGIIKGNGDGTLGVNKNLTLEEAAAMALRAIGYETAAENAGGYPTGFNSIAFGEGLMDNVTASVGGLLTLDSSVILVYNMMNMDLMTINSTGDYSTDEGKTLMNSVFDIYMTEGIVEENGYSNIYTGQKNENGYLVVNGEMYKTDERYFRSYLGYNAKIYYEEDNNERHIIYVGVKRNSIKSLDISDVADFTAKEVVYYDKTKKTLRLADDVIVIYNGGLLKLLEKGTDIPINGTMELIDNNRDGRYDVVNIESYKVVVVNDVNVSDGIIYDRYSMERTVDTSKYESVEIYRKMGEKAGLSDVKKDDVLFVYADSDFNCVRIIVSDDTVSFKVNTVSLESSDSNRYYTVTDKDGNTYKTGFEFIENEGLGAIKSGTEYEFLLDPSGKIASIKASVNETMKFGYLCKWWLDDGKDSVCLKIFTTDNKFEDIMTERKISLGSKTGKVTQEHFLELVKKPQLIRYRTGEDNVIKEVEFSSDDEESDGLRKISTVPNSGFSYNNRYYSSTGLIGGRVLVNGDTGIFIVPDDTESGNTDKYSYKPCTYLTNEQYYPGAEAYATVRNSVTARIVVLKNQAPVLKRQSPVMLVTSIGEYYNETGAYTGITVGGFQAGNDVNFKCAENVIAMADVGTDTQVSIEPGDAVRLILDDDGYVAQFKLMFDASERKVYGVNNGDDTGIIYGSETRHLYGKAYKIYGNYLKIQRSGDNTPMDELFPLTGSTRIYEVDMSKQGSKRFRIVGRNDIMTLSSDSELYDNIFVHTQFELTSLIVIYK